MLFSSTVTQDDSWSGVLGQGKCACGVIKSVGFIVTVKYWMCHPSVLLIVSS